MKQNFFEFHTPTKPVMVNLANVEAAWKSSREGYVTLRLTSGRQHMVPASEWEAAL